MTNTLPRIDNTPLRGDNTPLTKNTHTPLTGDEVHSFMKRFSLDINQFAKLLGVSPQAVRLWITGSRPFNETNSRLLRMFERRPSLMGEF
jgi:DNA-binding transcriptional regulator YiaG